MPDSGEKFESATKWSAINPAFSHKMIVPVKEDHIFQLLRTGFLIEVWDRNNTGGGKDSLIGLVKIDTT